MVERAKHSARQQHLGTTAHKKAVIDVKSNPLSPIMKSENSKPALTKWRKDALISERAELAKRRQFESQVGRYLTADVKEGILDCRRR